MNPFQGIGASLRSALASANNSDDNTFNSNVTSNILPRTDSTEITEPEAATPEVGPSKGNIYELV
jgi:hypothetical protein